MLSCEVDRRRRGRKGGVGEGVELMLDSHEEQAVGSVLVKSGSGSSRIMPLFVVEMEMLGTWSKRLFRERLGLVREMLEPCWGSNEVSEARGVDILLKDTSDVPLLCCNENMGDSVVLDSGLVGLEESIAVSMLSKIDEVLYPDRGELGPEDSMVEVKDCTDCRCACGF